MNPIEHVGLDPVVERSRVLHRHAVAHHAQGAPEETC